MSHNQLDPRFYFKKTDVVPVVIRQIASSFYPLIPAYFPAKDVLQPELYKCDFT